MTDKYFIDILKQLFECKDKASFILSKYGITVKDENGKWRSTYDVLKDLCKLACIMEDSNG